MTDTGRSYWERHAKRYDKSTRFLSRPVPRMLELAVEAAKGRERVLEVAAGTGLITTAIAPVVGELIATDYAASMVQQLDNIGCHGRVRVCASLIGVRPHLT